MYLMSSLRVDCIVILIFYNVIIKKFPVHEIIKKFIQGLGFGKNEVQKAYFVLFFTAKHFPP